MSDPAPAPAAPAVAQSFIAALLDRSPDSFWRLGAAISAVVLPFLNATCQAKLGFSVPNEQILAAEAALGVYITQSAAKAMHANWLDSKATTP